MSQSIQVSVLIFLISLCAVNLNAAGGEKEEGEAGLKNTTTTIVAKSSGSASTLELSHDQKNRSQLRTDIHTTRLRLADLDGRVRAFVEENRRLCEDLEAITNGRMTSHLIRLSFSSNNLSDSDSDTGDESGDESGFL